MAKAFKYRCKKCGNVSEHGRLARNEAYCSICKRRTAHLPVAPVAGLKASVPPGAPVKAAVGVSHEPLTLAPEPESKAASEAGAETGEGEALPPVEGIPDADTMTDLYKVIPEAIALGLQAPQVQLPEESCRVQGIRLARFCQRHNIVMPLWLDAVPIASRAIGDYTKFATDLSLAVKDRKAVKAKEQAAKKAKAPSEIPGEVSIPESSVERVSTGAEQTISDEELKARLEGKGRKG
jgi:hypothetical protein